ncbi:Arylalkylamine N-acetyltransferase-like 7 [Carabus blaptoides fortunei]
MDYGPIPVSRYGEVIEHLRFNFFPDEPLNNSVGLCSKGKPHMELEAHSMDTLKDEMSIMAVDKETGKIAGVALNGISHRGDIMKAQQKLKTVLDIKFRRIFGLLYNINQELDLFSKYNVDDIFEFRIVSVDSRYRGSGIAKQLMLRSELIAEEYGFKDVYRNFRLKIENCGEVPDRL